ncbi:unnamed protein product, partial [Chrysoparadoxa australica]
ESPKRCGQLAGVRLIDRASAVQRLSAAVAARDEMQANTVLIGRTDALQPEGLDRALDRARAYRDTGIDLVFVDGVKTRAEVEGISQGLDGPKMVSLVDGTDAAQLGLSDLEDMGFCVALYAVTALFGAISGAGDALTTLAQTGRPPVQSRTDYGDYAQVVDLVSHQAFSHQFESDV